MFHVKSDKRSKTSASLIIEGLYRCLEEKDFSSITITDVQKASTVGRATFYRLFDCLPDVLEYQCDLVFQSIMQEGSRTPASGHEALTIFFDIWAHQKKLLSAVINSGHLEILYTLFRKYSPAIKNILSPEITVSEEEMEYVSTSLSLGVVGVLETWLKHGCKKTPEELARLFELTISLVYTSL